MTFLAELSTKDRQTLGTALDGQLHTAHKRKTDLSRRRNQGCLCHERTVSGQKKLNERIEYLKDLKRRIGFGRKGDKVSQQPKTINADMQFVDEVTVFEESLELDIDIIVWEGEGGSYN